MSDSRAKAERSAAKDARQMQAPDRASNGKKVRRVRKPFELWWRHAALWPEWSRYSRYATDELRDKNLADMKRKHGSFEWEPRDAC